MSGSSCKMMTKGSASVASKGLKVPSLVGMGKTRTSFEITLTSSTIVLGLVDSIF